MKSSEFYYFQNNSFLFLILFFKLKMVEPDIILKCGFSVINYERDFKNDKGIKLVESGHVHTVIEVKQPNGYSTITGFVIRQTSVSLPPYKVKLEVLRSDIYFIIL